MTRLAELAALLFAIAAWWWTLTVIAHEFGSVFNLIRNALL